MLTTTYSPDYTYDYGIGITTTSSGYIASKVKKSPDGKTLSWYSQGYNNTTANASYQLNESAYTYYWINIG